MERFPGERPKKTYQGTNPEKIAVERIAENKLLNDESTIAEKNQKQRDELASKLRQARRARDMVRVESETIPAKARSLFGLKNGAKELSAQADRLQRDLKSELRYGKSSIERSLDQDVKTELAASVYEPIRELKRASTIMEASQSLNSINVVNLLSAIDTSQRNYVLAALDHALRYSETESKSHIEELARKVLVRDLQGDGSLVLARNPERYLTENILRGMSEPDRGLLFRQLEERPELLRALLVSEKAFFVELYLRYGGANSSDLFREIVQTELEGSNAGFYVQRFFEQEVDAMVKQIVQEQFDMYLQEKFSIAFSDIKGRWEMSHFAFDSKANLNAMLDIEHEIPGGVRRLLKEYGIVEFRRYPPDVLLTQLREESLQQPYGIIMLAQADHNGAFDQNKEVLQKLYEQTRGHYGLKVFEVDGVYQMARDFVALDKRYGATNKISFAVIGGHGEENTIFFGDGRSKGRFQDRTFEKEDLQGQGVQRVAAFFEPNPNIVLISCSTGNEEAIGQEISRTLAAEVIAPERPGSLKDINVSYDENDRVIFNVEFSVDEKFFPRASNESPN